MYKRIEKKEFLFDIKQTCKINETSIVPNMPIKDKYTLGK